MTMNIYISMTKRWQPYYKNGDYPTTDLPLDRHYLCDTRASVGGAPTLSDFSLWLLRLLFLSVVATVTVWRLWPAL